MQNKPTFEDSCERCKRRTHKYCQGIGLPYILNLVQTTCCKRKICSLCISTSPNCLFCQKDLKNYPPKTLEHEDENVTLIERARRTVHPSLGTNVPLFSDESTERVYEICLERVIEFTKDADAGNDPEDRAREAPHIVRKLAANSGVDGQAEYDAFIKRSRNAEAKFLQELCKCMPVYGGTYDEDFTLPTDRRDISSSALGKNTGKTTMTRNTTRQLSIREAAKRASVMGARIGQFKFKSVTNIGKDGKKVLTLGAAGRRIIKVSKKKT